MQQSLGAAIESPALAAMLAAVCLLGLLGLYWRGARWRALLRRRGVQRTAQKAEDSAQALLRAAGYRVVGVHVTRPWPVRLGGRTTVINLVADLLVEKRGRRYVAEVKSGDLVSSIRHGPTRRQILEYSLAFDSQAVLLVDARRGTFETVGFPRATARRARARLSAGLAVAFAALLLGVCVGLWLAHGGLGRDLTPASHQHRGQLAACLSSRQGELLECGRPCLAAVGQLRGRCGVALDQAA